MKKIIILFATVFVLLCLCAVASAETGWKKDGDYLYYLKDDVPVTGSWPIGSTSYYFESNGQLKGYGKTVYLYNYGTCYLGTDNKLQYGWKTVEGNRYYFYPATGKAAKAGDQYYIEDNDGNYIRRVTVEIDGSLYVFNSSGVLMVDDWYENYYGDANGKIVTGYRTIGENKYLFDNNGLSLSEFQTVNGKQFYFGYKYNVKGNPQAFGWRAVGTVIYYFDPVTGEKQVSKKTIDGQEREFNEDGTLIYTKPVALKFIDGSVYGYTTAATQLTGWQTVEGATYYFNSAAYKGARSIYNANDEKNDYYYFDADGKLQKNLLIKLPIDDKGNEAYFYYGSEGKRMYGWQTINGNKYYFGYDDRALIGPSQIEENKEYFWYYFSNEGVLQTNLLIKHSDRWGEGEYYYYYGADGKRYTGWLTLNDKKYYFSPARLAGVNRIENDYYYFDEEGVLQTKLLTKQVVDDEGNERYFYYGEDGKRMYGWQTINGNKYYFGNDGCAYIGPCSIEEDKTSSWYYFNNEGVLQTNLLIKHTLYRGEENEYYFYYGSDGKRVFGWQTIDKKTYYFDGSYGIAVTGAQSISDGENEDYYYFDSDGVMQKDLLIKHPQYNGNANEYYYYYDSDGKRVSGWKTIKGDKYYFDKRNGALTGTHTINDTIYTFSDEGKLLETVVPVTSVTLNKTYLELKPGYSETLTATVKPDDATNKKVKWGCSDTNIAKVDQNGKVTAVGSGYAIVWVKTEYGDYENACEVAVAEVNPIEAFVTRCYRLILNRDPDADGLAGWCETLAKKTATAAQIINGFVSSDEYNNRNLSAGESVDILYNTMLNRAADEGGKAGWVDALGKGYTLQNIIDGFCGSPEFVGLCKDYGIEPGSVNAPAPADMSTPRGKIEAFVKRCYSLILSREADQGGLQGWSDALESGAGQACQIIDGFVRSEEYTNRNLDAGASVDILYKTMLNREPDPDGRAGWVDALGQGYTLQHIINGFCGSAEFTAICNDYGITAGTLSVASALVKREAITPEGDEAEAPVVYQGYNSEFINEEKIRAFVEHCYVAVFGREGDAEGIENYTKLILNGKKMPKRVAYEFIFSSEFQEKLPGNEEFIRILYRLYFDREPGADELAGWVTMLENGASLEEIVNGFAGSAEFKGIVNAMKE